MISSDPDYEHRSHFLRHLLGRRPATATGKTPTNTAMMTTPITTMTDRVTYVTMSHRITRMAVTHVTMSNVTMSHVSVSVTMTTPRHENEKTSEEENSKL